MRTLSRNVNGKKIIVNPSLEELREMAKHQEQTTQYGSANYVTKVRNRSAKMTYVVAEGIQLGVKQQPIALEKAQGIVDEVLSYLKNKEVIRVDRQMGMGEGSFHCRLYITKEFARIPYMWTNTLFPAASPDNEPDFVSVYVPEWPERIIFVDPQSLTTYILGTDYFGECKKSFLRMAMYAVKQKGGLGLHAGGKILRVKSEEGLLERGFIMFGLSGTGKTTLTVHDHGLEGEEGVVIRQDDVLMLYPDGSCKGTENGFFIKTEGLAPGQKVLYDAAIDKSAIFENVMVLEDGTIDFADTSLTSNGRGIVLREKIANTDSLIDLEKADKVIFITRRNDIVPPVAKLNAQQAAAFFMLGESIETSAGDPTKAGQSKREVGTNPFIIGPEAEEGNRFFEILKNNPDMECFLMNTGCVGAAEGNRGEKITIKVSTEIMKQIAKGGITWETDPDWGYQVAKEIPGLDMEKYNCRKYFSSEEYKKRVEKLRRERMEWLSQFPGLNPQIVEAITSAGKQRVACFFSKENSHERERMELKRKTV
jgi:phosphoenolpyruvate carboxykinase (ATP)